VVRGFNAYFVKGHTTSKTKYTKDDIINDFFLKEKINKHFTFRYICDVLSLNKKNFSNLSHLIYPVELVVKDTTDSPNSASYLDLDLEHDINGTLTTL